MTRNIGTIPTNVTVLTTLADVTLDREPVTALATGDTLTCGFYDAAGTVQGDAADCTPDGAGAFYAEVTSPTLEGTYFIRWQASINGRVGRISVLADVRENP